MDRRSITSRENLKKVDYKNRPKKGKHKTTLLKEQAELTLRERYIKKMMPYMDSITDVHIKEAHNPKNTKERIDALEQLIDKPKQRTEVDINIEKLDKLTNSIKKILEK